MGLASPQVVHAFAAKAAKPAAVNPMRNLAKPIQGNALGLAKAYGAGVPAAPAAPPVPVKPQPVAATVPGTPAAAVPPPALPDFKDSVYYGGADAADRQRQADLAGLDKADQYGQVDLADRLKALAQAQVQGEQSARQNANRSGLFYSSFLTNNLNDLRTDYGNQEAAASEAERRAVEGRNAQRGQAQTTYDNAIAALAAQAVERRIGLDGQEPATAWGQGATAGGNFAGVNYTNGTPQAAPTWQSVLQSGSLLGTGMDASAKKPKKK